MTLQSAVGSLPYVATLQVGLAATTNQSHNDVMKYPGTQQEVAVSKSGAQVSR